MALKDFSLPKRDHTRTDSYRLVQSSSYRAIFRMLCLLVFFQLLNIALLIAMAHEGVQSASDAQARANDMAAEIQWHLLRAAQ